MREREIIKYIEQKRKIKAISSQLPFSFCHCSRFFSASDNVPRIGSGVCPVRGIELKRSLLNLTAERKQQSISKP